MQRAAWNAAIRQSADPPRATAGLAHLKSGPAAAFVKKATAEQARVLTALFSGSQILGELLLQHPDWVAAHLDVRRLQHPRRAEGLRREVDSWLGAALEARDYAGGLARLREFRQREMLRIAARDLARLADATEITLEISNVADVCLESTYQLCARQLRERFGRPFHQDPEGRWHPTAFCVLGLGKLGGQELNYSSDVDLMFAYSEEGFLFKDTPEKPAASGRGLTNHQFFKRLIEAFVAELTRLTPEGSLFRIDLRLRPEGDAGPLARSLGSYENYYAQWGQTWERMMLVKARGVAGDAGLAFEFLEMIQPFRYPRFLSENTVREVAAMKQRIEKEVVKAGELDRNVKLGRGGIREIEFVAQTHQLLHAGRIPFLQSPQTLPALQKLAQYRLLLGADATALSQAYLFLRGVEHRLQMENNLQTHTIPAERKARERLARLMGFDTLSAFEAALRQQTREVRRVYDSLLAVEAAAVETALPGEFVGRGPEWLQLLASRSFRDPEKSLRILETLVAGPGYVHVSPRTTELGMQLVQRLLALCPRRLDGRVEAPPNALSDPDRVVARLDSFVQAYRTRAILFELWTAQPSLFELLLQLFDRSEFLAERAIRTPDLVDELVLSGRLRRFKSAAEILGDLRHGLQDTDQKLWLRRYHEAEQMRIGLRDILGLADWQQNLAELTALADACLQYALEVALRRSRLKSPPLVIVGMGKLGGSELNYGSDLDVVFVAGNKVKNLPALQKLAVEVMDLLSDRTESGLVFQIDARLRPDGEKGLLVNTLQAYEEYYRHRAQLWEIQVLTRTRPVAGDLELGAEFQTLAATLTNFARPSTPLAAFQPDWKSEIARMRVRIEKERTAPGKDALAIKTGRGGLIDAEFIAQTLCLERGWHEANTLRALELARTHGALEDGDADLLISNYQKLRRIEGILRRWSYEGETALPDDPAPLHRVAVRCGFVTAGEFMIAVSEYRSAIRSVFSKVFAGF